MHSGRTRLTRVVVIAGGVVLFVIGVLLLPRHLWAALWPFALHGGGQTIPGLILVALGLVAVLAGVGLVTSGLLRPYVGATNARWNSRRPARTVLDHPHATSQLRVVGIGGGTGLSILLRGFKVHPVDLSAIVTVSDDGGSSGRLRRDLDMPPPGDIRACLVALAEAESLMESLFQHRFRASSGDLHGHNLGNLIITGLQEMTGDFQHAIQEASRVLAVRGRVLPSAPRALVLKAVMADGTTVEGETAIVAHCGRIERISVEPPDVQALPEAVEAIQQADVILVGPGSVYTSLLPNLVIPGMAEALGSSRAMKFFICNVMTQPGETDGFDAARHLEVVLEHLPCDNPFHYVVVNLQRPPQEVLQLYAEKGQHLVEPELERIRATGSVPVTGYLLADAHLARHDPAKLARTILERVVAHNRTASLA